MSDSAVLPSAGSSFPQRGAKTDKSHDFDDRLLLVLSDGGTQPPAANSKPKVNSLSGNLDIRVTTLAVLVLLIKTRDIKT